MNKTERKMCEILEVGRESFGFVSVKAEFEAEGTRMDELLRLVDIARVAGLDLTVKIGGCEAIRDLLESKQIGVQYVVAPMVETPYALSKYIAAKNMIFSEEELIDTDFLFNLETVSSFQHLNEMVSIASQGGGLQGLVFGRVDFAGSLNLSREKINDNEITKYVIETSSKAKEFDLDFVMGGGISNLSLPVIKKVSQIHLSRFETRKVVFDGKAAQIKDIERGLLNAVHFELLWLLNKREYYSRITNEDAKRIEMLESRWNVLSSS